MVQFPLGVPVYALIEGMSSSGFFAINPANSKRGILYRLTFTQEADEPPDEVAAAVAEGGFGQGDFLQAVARCDALILGLKTGARFLLQGQGARCPAVRGVRVRRCTSTVSHCLVSDHKQIRRRV